MSHRSIIDGDTVIAPATFFHPQRAPGPQATWGLEIQHEVFTAVPWPPPPRTHTLHKGQVDVWALPLNARPEELEAFETLLDDEERARAARFRFPLHRRRFIAGRGRLRMLLASYLRRDPAELRWKYGPAGKPELSLASCPPALHFNFTHSEDLALCALTHSGPLGIDCERVRSLSDAAELVSRFFSPRENVEFLRLEEAQRPEAFFNLWTRKEAILKATGEGIAHALNRVEVSFLPGEPARLLAAPRRVLTQPWQLYNLSPESGYAAALALPNPPAQLRLWRWLA